MPFNFAACFVLEIPARSAAVVHRLVVSRICEKRRGRPAGRRFQRRENTKRRVHVLRIESARLAMRAARALRLAARAERYIPPSKARSTFAATPPEAQQGDARRNKCFGVSKETVDRGTHDAPQINNLPVIQFIFDIGKLARHRRRQQWPTSCEPAASRSAATSRGCAKKT